MTSGCGTATAGAAHYRCEQQCNARAHLWIERVQVVDIIVPAEQFVQEEERELWFDEDGFVQRLAKHAPQELRLWVSVLILAVAGATSWFGEGCAPRIVRDARRLLARRLDLGAAADRLSH